MATELLILGLDGATFEVLGPLMASGRCPNLAALAARGVSAPLRSTAPPMTAAAWAAFLTGKGPGGTGIASFRHLDLGRYSGYDPRMVTSADLRGSNWLEIASRAGVAVSSVGLPMTYPPFPIQGVLVSGFPRPPRPGAPVEPGAMAGRWGRWDEPADASSRDLGEGERPAACAHWDRRHAQISLDLLENRSDRVHVCVFSGTDHMAHLFWRHRREGGPHASALEDHYALVDGLCGELVAAAGPGATVLVASDHGFGPAETEEVHLDRWLAGEGWLRVRGGGGGGDPVGRLVAEARRRVPKGLWKRWRDRLPGGMKARLYDRAAGRDRVDWPRTRAYRIGLYQGWEGVNLNVRGRQPLGIVEPGAPWRAEREALIATLGGARLPDGRPMAREVHRGEDVWPGERAGRLPDVLMRLSDGLRGGGGLPPGPAVTPVPAAEGARISGTHRPEGVFIAAGPLVAAGASPGSPRIVDVMPTVLALLGLPIPSDVEGRPLTGILTPEAAARLPPRRGPPVGPPGGNGDGGGLDGASAAAVEASLRALGYLS